MSFIGDAFRNTVSTVSNTVKSTVSSVSNGASKAATLTTSSLSSQSNPPSGSGQGNAVTDSQGQAARSALGSGGASQGGMGFNPLTSISEAGGSLKEFAGAVKAKLAQTNNYDTSLKTNNSEALDPSSKASRLSDLSTFSQRDNDGKTTNDGQRCAATSLTAAMYHAEGVDGLTKLMDGADKFHADNSGDTRTGKGPDFTAVRKKIKDGETLTKGDLSHVSEGIHHSLRDSQYIIEGETGIPELEKGVSPPAVKRFLDSSAGSDISKTLKDNDSMLAIQDMDGNGSFDHFVARLGNAIYDPEAISNGSGQLSQVVTGEGMIDRYKESNQRAKQSLQ